MPQWGYVVKPLKKNLISLFYEFRVNRGKYCTVPCEGNVLSNFSIYLVPSEPESIGS